MLKDKLLLEIQHNFPLVERPFLEIANRFGVKESEVLSILAQEKERGIIRQTSAIFDTKALNYHSSLVAFKVHSQDLFKAIEIVNSHPGVSHNYERDHNFNLWFTIAVPPDSILGLEKTIQLLAFLSKVNEYLILPTIKMFKISVKLNTTNTKITREDHKVKNINNLILTSEHHNVILQLQNDIQFVPRPFEQAVQKSKLQSKKFFDIASELLDNGIMRRFASILNHRKAGFKSNAMVTWEVDEKDVEKFGKVAASFSAVSHCYLRKTYLNWPYNLFTMIHAQSDEELEEIIEEIKKELKFKSMNILHSVREFKKVRILYFSEKFYQWEEKYGIYTA